MSASYKKQKFAIQIGSSFTKHRHRRSFLWTKIIWRSWIKIQNCGYKWTKAEEQTIISDPPPPPPAIQNEHILLIATIRSVSVLFFISVRWKHGSKQNKKYRSFNDIQLCFRKLNAFLFPSIKLAAFCNPH